MRILRIETSCDETGIAIYDDVDGVANLVYSQVDIQRQSLVGLFEPASRDHIRKTLPLIQQAMLESGSKPTEIDAIAYTTGPGLVGALMVGACTHKSLAMAWDIPSVGVHHMEGHLLAPLLADDPPDYPSSHCWFPEVIRSCFNAMLSANMNSWESRSTMPQAKHSTKLQRC